MFNNIKKMYIACFLVLIAVFILYYIGQEKQKDFYKIKCNIPSHQRSEILR